MSASRLHAPSNSRRRARARTLLAVKLLLISLLGACGEDRDPAATTRSPTGGASARPTSGDAASPDVPRSTRSPAAPEATRTTRPTASPTPAPTPEPSFSLAFPTEEDARRVSVAVSVDPASQPPRLLVRVTSLADSRINELLLRWSAELHEVLYLAPFVATPDRIGDGAPPLSSVVDWTRWVIGPGSDGEPPGTITLGYGPLDPGTTLEIPLYVLARDASGPLAFDLQVLSSEVVDGDPPRRDALLSLDDGSPAELRVELP